jgi:hypothetical protein
LRRRDRRIVRNVEPSAAGRSSSSAAATARARRAALRGSIFLAAPGGGFELEERIGAGSEFERHFLPRSGAGWSDAGVSSCAID